MFADQKPDESNVCPSMEPDFVCPVKPVEPVELSGAYRASMEPGFAYPVRPLPAVDYTNALMLQKSRTLLVRCDVELMSVWPAIAASTEPDFPSPVRQIPQTVLSAGRCFNGVGLC